MSTIGLVPEMIRKRSDFLAARAGERRRGRYFIVEVAARPDTAGPARVGYTVTKKQGNSVERNRIKRRLREAVRLAGRFAMKPGHDYVVVARREVLDAPFDGLTSALQERIGTHAAARSNGQSRKTHKNGPAPV